MSELGIFDLASTTYLPLLRMEGHSTVTAIFQIDCRAVASMRGCDSGIRDKFDAGTMLYGASNRKHCDDENVQS